MKSNWKAMTGAGVALALVLAPLVATSASADEVVEDPPAVVEVVQEAPAATVDDGASAEAPVEEAAIAAEPPAEEPAAPAQEETTAEEPPTVAVPQPEPSPTYEEKKVWVCKYVGTPHIDERLQTGQNPINVSVNSIQNNQWDGTVPGWFSDEHDRSYVIGYATPGEQPEPDVSDCPAPEPDYVYPTLQFTPPTCDADGVLTLGSGRWTWSAVLNEDGSTTYTATATEGAVIPEGTQFSWTVPNLDRLPADSDECAEQPIETTLAPPTWEDPCGTDNDFAYLPEDTESVDYEWASEDESVLDVVAFVAKGYVVNDVPEGWALVDETEDEYIYEWTYQFSDEPCDVPQEATLDGSFITPVCVDDAAYLRGTIAVVDPDNLVPDDATATITLTDGVNSFTYPQQFPLGEVNVLWPGASVDPVTGFGVTWPGYITNPDGTYTATDDPAYFGWTRGGVTVHVEVNPELDVQVNYPPASPLCLTSPPSKTPPAPASLAVTGGGDVNPLVPLAGGIASVLGGALALVGWLRRRSA